ncbi:MAG: hypothetical protein CMP61_04785 [Flavobacteriales bacterium]|nr:hypothetical protein [Flavobacteriales bacterium]
MIPQNFQQWHKCITQDCKIQLTKEFVEKRLSVYMDTNHSETIRFRKLYGDHHLSNVINWLQQV